MCPVAGLIANSAVTECDLEEKNCEPPFGAVRSLFYFIT